MIRTAAKLRAPVARRGFATIQAVTVKQQGDPFQVLEHSTKVEDTKKIGAKQVLVEMLYSAVSPSDLSSISGASAPASKLAGKVAGHSGAGVVKEAGSSVQSVKVGQVVAPSKAGLGTWQRMLVAQESDLIGFEGDVAPEKVAGGFTAVATSLKILQDYGIKSGETVVLDFANGPMGLPFVQIAAKKGVKVICITSGSIDYANTVEALKSAGALAVIDEQFVDSEVFTSIVQAQSPKSGIRCGSTELGAKALSNALGGDAKVIVVDGAAPVGNIKSEELSLEAVLSSVSAKDIQAELGALSQSQEIIEFQNFDEALARVAERGVDGSMLVKF